MPHIRSRLIALRLSLLATSLLLGDAASAQSVWSGLTTSFTKTDFSDHTLPENQDALTANVVLTRGGSGGMINIAAEQFFDQTVSPALTVWATDLNNSEETIAATNWQNLDFTNWLDAYGGPFTGGAFIAGRDAVVHLIPDDVYLDLRFTTWTPGNGGGYSYLRAESPTISPTGDFNGDGIVDAADYVIWRKNGINGQQGYNDWRANFGQTSGSGSLSNATVPEPGSVFLLILEAVVGTWPRRRLLRERRQLVRA